MRSGQFIATLLAAGLVLLAASIVFVGSAKAAGPTAKSYARSYPGPQENSPPPWRYTNHPSLASTGRVVPLFIDAEFDEDEREAIRSAMRQWNHVLNGFLQFQARLQHDMSPAAVRSLRRGGGWTVVKVDSSHPAAQGAGVAQGGRALALTSGSSRGGGFVYVIVDRIPPRTFPAVMMHEFGHVLGAAHNEVGLMAPVFSGTPCIDRHATALIAQAQRLPVNNMNWCEPAGVPSDPRYEPRSVQRHRSNSALSGWR